ncbi:MAG: V-type ATPase 116kDa subunit family protein [Candidatus Hydrogenedentes bacterium]|nr:V-type ATPase 116kDa subunit family protein [Candidatus Hydrogenedentota bacterium]
MAIDRMKKISIVCPLHSADRVNRLLFDLRAVEIVDAFDTHSEARGALTRHVASTEEPEQHLNKVHYVLSLLDEIAPIQKSFIEGLTPLPMLVEQKELDADMHGFSLDALYEEARALDDARKSAERGLTEVRGQLDAIAPLADVTVHVADLMRLKHTRVFFGTLPIRQVDAFKTRADLPKSLAWEKLPAHKLESNGRTAQAAIKSDRVRIVAACLIEDVAAVQRALASEQFEEIPLPDVPGSVRDRIRELEADQASFVEEVERIRRRIKEMAAHRRALQVLDGYWAGARRAQQAKSSAIDGRWVHVITGYCRNRDLPTVQSVLRKDVPEADLTAEDPQPSDAVPVSITSGPNVRPIQMLINLFGLPPYASFDPSPFIIINFLLFFGICFGDVGYGLALTTLGFYVTRKTRAYEGVNNFAKLLLYAGISTTIFGALMGSWLGDLYKPEYLGEGNLLLRLKDSMMVLDPLADPVTMLLLALGIGMLNQFYGIGLKMYGALRTGDKASAVFDGLLWLITLPGMVILVGTLFAPVPGPVLTAGLSLFFIGALGLILTQGRDQRGLFSRLGIGTVSLYGIVGSYGCTAFIGDVLSYCRLLALALTTSIVALTVNLIADLMRDAPVVGPVLFVLVLVLGHTFNFAISLLGAFVHAMRLIFVEFFGRFYEGGAKPFTPFGFDSPSHVLKRSANTTS